MNATPRELAAAHRLAECILEFVISLEEGRRSRAELLRRGGDPPPEHPGEGRLLLSAQEAAERLGVCEKTLWNWSAPHGPIPVVRFGRRVTYAINDLNDAISRMRTEPR